RTGKKEGSFLKRSLNTRVKLVTCFGNYTFSLPKPKEENIISTGFCGLFHAASNNGGVTVPAGRGEAAQEPLSHHSLRAAGTRYLWELVSAQPAASLTELLSNHQIKCLQIPKEVADIFNAPSDDEDFLGFQDDAPIQTLLSEDSCDSFEFLESGKKDVRLQSRYLTEELQKIFTEDTDSETEAFEGFASSEGVVNKKRVLLAQLLAELNSIPDLFPVKTPTSTPSKQKKIPRRTFSEGQIERRMNPTRNARPPEKFALEKFTVSAAKFAEHFRSYRQQNLLKKRLSVQGDCGVRKRRRSSKYSSYRPVEDITEEDLDNIAITVKDKIYDKVLGSTCHQCRQKTIDTKTICRNQGCGGVRGQFCGPCLRNRYGEDVKSALLDPDWICPPCRGICNCSYCRRRDGRCATGMLIHLAKFYGYNNVKEYLESLQKQLADDN
uniref:Cell division cycle associated 7 like n=1 Tax=Dromaius novaehollandiae TaxID=8790 RepID=A0A8C4KGC8_DRONO